MTTVAVKEKPILFSAPMVRAILDGRKSQTRRIVKPQPQWRLGYMAVDGGAIQCGVDYPDGADDFVRCPYGRTGDRLWVRETFWLRNHGNTFRGLGIDYKAGGNKHIPKPAKVGRLCCWRPSIHMPRWASRITLEITGVRVERLNDISEEDAEAEGATSQDRHFRCGNELFGCRSGFAILWSKINGPDSWDANPWVWVVEFKRLA